MYFFYFFTTFSYLNEVYLANEILTRKYSSTVSPYVSQLVKMKSFSNCSILLTRSSLHFLFDGNSISLSKFQQNFLYICIYKIACFSTFRWLIAMHLIIKFGKCICEMVQNWLRKLLAHYIFGWGKFCFPFQILGRLCYWTLS